ncbi:hypothetical protein LTR91_025592 [Friedmanniomyces endolithicus]|uniref:BHLH domain-containing protein n=1 Tax=Friedmanniomyces endolithicus TaxID=329885 RepID=A0AAN6JZ76_9PEZI|nr:hypothetical protein LTR91_025592 [Friedmanniomyces endolithicus]
MTNSSFSAIEFGPNDIMENVDPKDFFESGQAWECESQRTPACWSGVCSHGSTGANQNCPAMRMPTLSRAHTASRDAPLPTQSRWPVDSIHDSSFLPAEVDAAHHTEDIISASWQQDVANIAQADLMETLQPLSDVNDVQTSTKRAPTGELARPKARRMPHNLIERRYRDTLNHQIQVLRDELPTFKSIMACTADVEDATTLAGKWPSKAVVIAAAIQYIAQLELERGKGNARNSLLCEQVEGLQRLVRCDDCSIVKYLEAMQSRVLSGQ